VLKTDRQQYQSRVTRSRLAADERVLFTVVVIKVADDITELPHNQRALHGAYQRTCTVTSRYVISSKQRQREVI